MTHSKVTNIWEVIVFFTMLILFVFTVHYFGLAYEQKTVIEQPCIDQEYVKITLYHPTPSQTSKAVRTANGTKLVPGNLPKSIAISRDLESRFSMGDTISIRCNCPYEGNYLINDRLGKKANMQIDILTENDVDMFYGEILKIVKI